MGTTGQVAQEHGKEDYIAIQKILIKGMIIAVLVGVFFIALQITILDIVQGIIDVSIFSFNLIVRYYNIRIYTAPASILLFVINGWLLGIHKPKLALVIALAINSIKNVLSYALVNYFGLGINRVAISTLAAQYAGLVVGVVFVFIEYGTTWLSYIKRCFRRNRGWKEFLQVSGDLFI
tara:strand:+ start:51971 stop:52504 length:534 start_codon:yes stop_codon:yes gene_type:complete